MTRPASPKSAPCPREADIQAAEQAAPNGMADRPRGAMTVMLMLPPRECSPNWRGNWRKKARAVKLFRDYAHVKAKTADGLGRFERPVVQAFFFFKTNRRRDADNALSSLKAAFDGLTDAGAWADDSSVTHLPVVMLKDADCPHLVLHITEADSQ